METRTDIHRPVALITEDYEFAYAFDAHPEEGDRAACIPFVNMLLADGYKFGGVYGDGQCSHCGQHIRYTAVLKHIPTKTLIRVGEQCLDNRFALATEEFQALRKAAKLNRDRIKLSDRRAAWYAINPDREIAMGFCVASVSAGDYGYEGMRYNFVHNVNRYGETSDRFVQAIMRDMVRTDAREEKRAAEKAQAVPVPVIEGRTSVSGEVVSVKWQENDFGGREVMTVRDDRGFLLWGSVPSSLDGIEKGERVSFMATIQRSDRDETFGFFKRPSKAVRA